MRQVGYYGRYGPTRSELKFHDIDVDDVTVAAGMNVQTPLLKIGEGNGESQRVGRKVVIKKIGFRYIII